MASNTCNVDGNKSKCNCTFSCGKKGICCECIGYHRANGELPACYFPNDAEKSGNRSISNFVSIVNQKGTSFLR